MIDYSKLPEHIQEGAKLYIERGILPGSFLTACFENNFTEVMRCADHINIKRLEDIASWLYWDCPALARGNPQKVAWWMEQGGLFGIEK